MRLRLVGGPAGTRTRSDSPAVPDVPTRARRVKRGWRVRALARSAWCAHCEVRPRAGLEGPASRFCSTECADKEADANWSIW
jgi:hypothetical protein